MVKIKAEAFGMVGMVEVKLYGPTGLMTQYRKGKNLVVNTGFDTVCLMMGSPTLRPDPFAYVAIGTGTIAPSTLNTQLATEVARQQAGYTKLNDRQWRNDATFAPGVGTGAITESGEFNASSGGTMLCRQTFPVITKESADTLVLTWTFTLS